MLQHQLQRIARENQEHLDAAKLRRSEEGVGSPGTSPTPACASPPAPHTYEAAKIGADAAGMV